MINENEMSLDGFSAGKREFFRQDLPIVTVTRGAIQFNEVCGREMSGYYIQVLINPKTRKMIVLLCKADDKNSVKWWDESGGMMIIPFMGYKRQFPNFCEKFGWNPKYCYKAIGEAMKDKGEIVILFDLANVELYKPVDNGEGA